MATEKGILYNLRMALAPTPQPSSPWTSAVVRFKDEASLGDIDTAAKKIRLMRGVKKFDYVCHSQNPTLKRTFYLQIDSASEPFAVVQRIWNVQILNKDVVLSASIVRCADSSQKKRIPDEPS